MKSTTRIVIACAALAIVAGGAFAQLSPEYRDWAKGPVQFIMTPQEVAQFNQLKTDAEAKAFVDLFWAKRDPTPGTAANEYRQNFEAAVKYADEHFSEGRRKGSLTDRGRILLLLGPPSRVQTQRTPQALEQTDTAANPGTEQTTRGQVWIYDAGRSPVLGNTPAQITFTDQFGTGQLILERGGRTDVNELTRRALQVTVVNPNLTEVPKTTAQEPMTEKQPSLSKPVTPAPVAAAGLTAFKTDSLKTAVDQVKTAKNNPYKGADITYTELLSPLGDYFVPVQLYIPKSAGLTAAQVTTFFGTLEDSTGNNVAVFEEPATLSTSNGDLYFDRSLTNLKPGTYRATLGLADKDGKPVVMSTQPIELKPMAKDETGVSRLVLAGDVHQTDTAAVAGAPYAFGRVKIVPKGDRTFSNRDEITYFVEVVNPGIDTETNMPKLQVKLELAGTGTKEKPGRTIAAPIADATPLPLTGAPGAGQYAILAGIPLGEMKTALPAGDYTLRVKVYDKVKNQSWSVEQPLKLVSGPASTTSAK
ncbi:MAG TPA: GWxTD domain-containing protein [Thermoanaerobaculia bacterium]